MLCLDTGAGSRCEAACTVVWVLADQVEAMLTDNLYDADATRDELVKVDVEAVISSKSNRRE